MKFLDRFLRDWRIRLASNYIEKNNKVLDIGCFDGNLFKSLKKKSIGYSIGLDPLLKEDIQTNDYKLIPGYFPDALKNNEHFDTITLLAVLEHIPRATQAILSDSFYAKLNKSGKVIITVPSPFVDHILWVLTKLRLVDGMSVDEHYGFKTEEVYDLFDKEQFNLITHKKFQLGLNNLFVFEKR